MTEEQKRMQMAIKVAFELIAGEFKGLGGSKPELFITMWTLNDRGNMETAYGTTAGNVETGVVLTNAAATFFQSEDEREAPFPPVVGGVQ